MRHKHIHIPEDSQLLIEIRNRVSEQLKMSKKSLYLTMWVKFALYFSALVLGYTSLLMVSNPIMFVFAFMGYGMVSLLLIFNFAHDFSHNTIFKNKKLNEYCYTALFVLVGAHAEAWKKRHVNAHHHAPNVEGYDSDLEISKIIRVTPTSKHYWFHRFQHVYAPITYTIYSLFWIFIKDFVMLFKSDVKRNKFGYILSFITQKIIYLVVMLGVPIYFSNQSIGMVMLAFLCMHFFMSLFLLFTFFITHHVESTTYPVADNDGLINSSWLMNQVKSSNDMHPFSKTANFILGGFNNHVAHHLFPNHHHLYYPKLSQIVYEVLQKHGIEPNQTSYLGGMISHLRLLKIRGSRTNYQVE